MVKFKLLITLVILFCSCKSDTVNTSSQNALTKNDAIIDKSEADFDDSNVASLIAGQYEGYGEFSTEDQKNDKEFTTIIVTRKSDKEVSISSPSNAFPSFLVRKLENQVTTIVGETDDKGGFLTYNKSQNKIKGLTKSYEVGSTVFRFIMP